MVTMGIGTGLKLLDKLATIPHKQKLEKQITNNTLIMGIKDAKTKKKHKEFVGYIDSQVTQKKITCKLVGKRNYKSKIFIYRNKPAELPKNIYDEFTITAR